MSQCDVCGAGMQNEAAFTCNYCGREFCSEHRLPENHDCLGLDGATTLGPELRQSIDEMPNEIGAEPEQESNSEQSVEDRNEDPDQRDRGYAGKRHRDWKPDTSTPDVVVDKKQSTRSSKSQKLPLSYRLKRLRRTFWRHIPSPKSIILFVIVVLLASFVIGISGGIGVAPIDDASDTVVEQADQAAATFNSSSTTTEDYEIAIHEEINELRAEEGLSQLGYNEPVSSVAREHSEHMATNDYFDHDTPGGFGPQDRIDRAGIDCLVGENIAHRDGHISDPEELADQIVTLWLNSPPHRENMLDREYTSQGIGVYRDGSDVWVTQKLCL